MLYYLVSLASPSPDLAFQMGVRYTYRYSVTIATTLQGSTTGRSGLALDCVVDIDVINNCHFVMQVSVFTCSHKYSETWLF